MQRQSASDIPSQPTTTKTDTGMLKRCQRYITQDMLSALRVVQGGCCYNVYINCLVSAQMEINNLCRHVHNLWVGTPFHYGS